jgi:hypothetical protein
VAHIAALLLSLFDTVHRAQRDAVGLFWCSARGNFMLHARLKVKAQFFIQLCFQLRSPKYRP